MSWAWKGFFRDDPVFRFKEQDFFQSGRHAAEERFWKLKIHDDGSYVRRGNVSSMDKFYTQTGGEGEEEHGGGQQKRREGSVEEEEEEGDLASVTSEDGEEVSSTEGGELESLPTRLGIRRNKEQISSKDYQYSYPSQQEQQEETARRKQPELKEKARRREEQEKRRSREKEEPKGKVEEGAERKRGTTPEFLSYVPRARRMSELSSKDYPYAPASAVARVAERSSEPARAPENYQRQPSREEGRKQRREYVPEGEHISSRYF